MARNKKQLQARDEEFLPGGKAHPRRGEQSHELALAFLRDFPIGTVFSDTRFDAWTAQQLDMEIPAYGTITWKGHVSRRNTTIKQINAASTHPRMWDSEQPTYEIMWITPGQYEVRLINIKQTGERMAARTLSFLHHGLREMAHRLQAIKWDELPPASIGTAKHSLYSLEYFIDSVDSQLSIQRRLSNEVYRLQGINESAGIPLLPPGIADASQQELDIPRDESESAEGNIS